jgi:hypothetical protein
MFYLFSNGAIGHWQIQATRPPSAPPKTLGDAAVLSAISKIIPLLGKIRLQMMGQIDHNLTPCAPIQTRPSVV